MSRDVRPPSDIRFGLAAQTKESGALIFYCRALLTKWQRLRLLQPLGLDFLYVPARCTALL